VVPRGLNKTFFVETQDQEFGATTFSITALVITTINITVELVTLSIIPLY
jgi:hypothetical protein